MPGIRGKGWRGREGRDGIGTEQRGMEEKERVVEKWNGSDI